MVLMRTGCWESCLARSVYIPSSKTGWRAPSPRLCVCGGGGAGRGELIYWLIFIECLLCAKGASCTIQEDFPSTPIKRASFSPLHRGGHWGLRGRVLSDLPKVPQHVRWSGVEPWFASKVFVLEDAITSETLKPQGRPGVSPRPYLGSTHGRKA